VVARYMTMKRYLIEENGVRYGTWYSLDEVLRALKSFYPHGRIIHEC
jgi:hypothetical protein